MTLSEERYAHIMGDNPATDPAKKILFGMFKDILSRGGFDDVFDNLEEELQEEILQSNLDIINKILAEI